MPKRCARCGSLAGRGRELAVPAEWRRRLIDERGVSAPMGTLKMPLCTDCYPEVRALQEEGTDGEIEDLLAGLDTDALIDETTPG